MTPPGAWDTGESTLNSWARKIVAPEDYPTILNIIILVVNYCRNSQVFHQLSKNFVSNIVLATHKTDKVHPKNTF